MTPSKPKSVRWIPSLLLIVALGGLSVLLYVQRQQIANDHHEHQLQEVIRHRQGMSTAAEPELSPELTLARGKRLLNEGTERLDRHLKRLTDDASAAHSDFLQAFGRSGAKTVSLTPSPRANYEAEYNKKYREYCERDIDLYLEHTSDEGPLREQGEAFLRKSYARNFYDDSAPSKFEMGELAEGILNSETTDPFLRGRAADWIHPGGSGEELRRLCEREITAALKRLPETSYPAIAEVLLRVVLRERGPLGLSLKDDRRELLNFAIVRWMKKEAPHTEDHRFFFRRLNSLIEESEKAHLLWLAVEDGSIPLYWLHLLAGEYYLDKAQTARGSKYAVDVTPEQWSGFRTHIDKAKLHLQRAWHLRPDHPLAASLMIQATMGSGDGNRTVRDWFQKAVDAHFDFYPAYRQLQLAMLPRWGGSEAELIAFGNQCILTDRFDTFVPFMAIDVIEFIELFERHPREKLFVEVPDLRAMIDLLSLRCALWLKTSKGDVKPFVYPGFPDWPIDVYLANDAFNEARNLAMTTPDDFHFRRADRLFHPRSYEIAMFKASEPAVRDLIEKLDHALRIDRTPILSDETQAQLAADFGRLKEQATAPDAERCIKHLEKMLQQRVAFSRGEWVDVLAGPESFGWEFYGKHVKYDEATELWTVHDYEDAKFAVGGRPLAGFSFPLEVEMNATIPVIQSSSTGRAKGFHWAPPEGSKRPKEHVKEEFPYLRLFGLASEGRRGIMAAFPRDCNRTAHWNIEIREPAQHLRLKLWEKAFEFHVNEFSLCGPLCAPLDPQGMLTFGQEAFQADAYSDYSGGEISLRNVRVRRLSIAPIPDSSIPLDERVSYWQQRHDADADDLLATRELARALLENEPKRALELAQKAFERQPKLNGLHPVMAIALFRLGRRDEAEGELSMAEQNEMFEADTRIARIEECLTHPEPTPQTYESAVFYTSELRSAGEPVLSKYYAARVAFAQKDYQKAVELNQEGISLATGDQVDKLKQWQEKYEAALAEHAAQPAE